MKWTGKTVLHDEGLIHHIHGYCLKHKMPWRLGLLLERCHTPISPEKDKGIGRIKKATPTKNFQLFFMNLSYQYIYLYIWLMFNGTLKKFSLTQRQSIQWSGYISMIFVKTRTICLMWDVYALHIGASKFWANRHVSFAEGLLSHLMSPNDLSSLTQSVPWIHGIPDPHSLPWVLHY